MLTEHTRSRTRQKVEEKLRELEELSIISRKATPYCSPVTFTTKADGSIRILLDAREINKHMVAEAEAPPMQIDILNAFHGVKFISLILLILIMPIFRSLFLKIVRNI